MSATAAQIEAKARELEDKAWNFSLNKCKKLPAGFGFGYRRYERYHKKGENGMEVVVFVEATVYETEAIARKSGATRVCPGKRGWIGGWSRREIARRV